MYDFEQQIKLKSSLNKVYIGHSNDTAVFLSRKMMNKKRK